MCVRRWLPSAARAVKVETGKGGQDGKRWPGRERDRTITECHVTICCRQRFPDRDCPTASVFGFCFRRPPSRCKVSCSRPGWLPSHWLFLPLASPFLLLNQLFLSHLDVTTQFLPLRISILGQFFPVHLEPDVSFSHHVTIIMDALLFFCSSHLLSSRFLFPLSLPRCNLDLRSLSRLFSPLLISYDK